jgi:hypothetical protein
VCEEGVTSDGCEGGWYENLPCPAPPQSCFNNCGDPCANGNFVMNGTEPPLPEGARSDQNYDWSQHSYRGFPFRRVGDRYEVSYSTMDNGIIDAKVKLSWWGNFPPPYEYCVPTNHQSWFGCILPAEPSRL